MMTQIRRITVSGVFVALLLGGQFVLSGVAGVEIVTPLLLSFCLYFGVGQGLLVATSFSLLRCILFGFTPTALILYLIYYNLFAVLFGLIGHKIPRPARAVTYVILTACAVGCTAVFTLLDDAITPLFYGFTLRQTQAYFLTSLPVLGIQCLCTLVSVPLLTPPLLRAYRHLPHGRDVQPQERKSNDQ